MKKRLALVLTMICSCFIASSASANDFVLRNGIAFGDSFETVSEKESVALKDLETDEDDSSITYVRSEATEVANYRDTPIYFYFKDDKLYEMDYLFGQSGLFDVYDDFKANYEAIWNNLADKYGEPIIAVGKDDSMMLAEEPLVHSNVWDYRLLNELIKRGANIGKIEWLVEEDDGYVLIDYVFGIDSEDIQCRVGYRFVSNEEQEILEREKATQDEAAQEVEDGRQNNFNSDL